MILGIVFGIIILGLLGFIIYAIDRIRNLEAKTTQIEREKHELLAKIDYTKNLLDISVEKEEFLKKYIQEYQKELTERNEAVWD